jgi:hypothetical protein
VGAYTHESVLGVVDASLAHDACVPILAVDRVKVGSVEASQA